VAAPPGGAILEQDSGILNVTLENSGSSTRRSRGSPPQTLALIAIILVNIWLGIPFNLTLLYSGLQDIPDELYEAGALDGATGWKAFWNITWPNLHAVVSIVIMLGVIYTLKVLDIILGLTQGGPANATQTIATLSYQRSFVEFKFGQGAALSNILILISLVFAIVLPAGHAAPGRRVRSRRWSLLRRRLAARQTRRGLRTGHRHRSAGSDALPGLLDAQHLAAAQRGHFAVELLPPAAEPGRV
jgi:ABC-type Fe3+ transport system permease subunit